MVVSRPKRSECPECHSKTLVLKNLYVHMRTVHFWEEKRVQELKRTLKLSGAEGRKTNDCEECQRVYCSLSGLALHMKPKRVRGLSRQCGPNQCQRGPSPHPNFCVNCGTRTMKVHGIDENSTGRVTCPSCGKHFTSHSKLALHCLEVHKDENPDQDYRTITGTLADWTQFEKWKRAKEQNTVTRLMIRSSCESKDRRITTYLCEYARGKGDSPDLPLVRKRNRASKRVHSHCSAFLKAILNSDGSVEYFGTFGHIGHPVITVKVPSPPIDEQLNGDMSRTEHPTSTVSECSPTNSSSQNEVLPSSITKDEHSDLRTEEVHSDITKNECDSLRAEEVLPNDLDENEYSQLQAEEVLLRELAKIEYNKLQAVQTQFNEIACLCLRDGWYGALRELRTAMEAAIQRVTSATGIECSALARMPVIQKHGDTHRPQLLSSVSGQRTEPSTDRKCSTLTGRSETRNDQEVKAETE
ncbi:hypothetical protein Y032_0002g529 [Ancylostoma ceylanicum]|uniref:C2H2-type domain-containing protein n=1 Tax=Ancylostoma ceylanicum TaxID=53326 RepID=A0A016W109_9BILA|nr:hypothetical protein Y032_0002g529 [Ancylostoma ceylanicum]